MATASAPEGPRVLLSVESAAMQLSISRTRAYALIKTGDLISVRIGRLRRIPVDALTAYIDELRAAQLAALIERKDFPCLGRSAPKEREHPTAPGPSTSARMASGTAA